MSSNQKGSMSQMAKMSKAQLKVSSSMQRGPDVNHPMSPHRGPSSSHRGTESSQSPSPHRGGESRHSHMDSRHSHIDSRHSHMDGRHTATSHRGLDSRPISPQYGLDFSRTTSPHRGQRVETIRHPSPHRRPEHSPPSHVSLSPGRTPMKYDSLTRGSPHRPLSPPTQDQTRKHVAAPGQEHRRNLSPSDGKTHLRPPSSSQKESPAIQVSQSEMEPPPSKVTNPQGVRSPRRRSLFPRDESTQTDTKSEGKSTLRKPASSETTQITSLETKPNQRILSMQDPESGTRSTIHAEAKGSHRNLGSLEVESAVKVSFRKDPDCTQKATGQSEADAVQRLISTPTRMQDGDPSVKSSARPARDPRRVTILTESESNPSWQPCEPYYKAPVLGSSLKSSASDVPVKVTPISEAELTPRPLPPRSLPKYGPESSWWILFHPEPSDLSKCDTVLSESEPRTSPLNLFMSQLEIASAYCDELVLQSEKATSPEPQSPCKPSSRASSRDLLKTALQPLDSSDCVDDGTIQRFSAFFLGMF